jgi:predicted thioredoxin/glutaredoxin
MISFKVESDFFKAQLMSAALVGSPDLALRYEAEVAVERLREIRMRMRAQGQMSTLKREQQTMKGDRP